jgi:hypothetical protein
MRILVYGIVTIACLSACTDTGSGGQGAASPSGGPVVCSDFADQSGLAPVTMHLINDTGQPILISPGPACWKSPTPPPFSIVPATGSDGTTYPSVNKHGSQTCSFRLTSPAECEDCWFDDPYTLMAPGATLDLPWDGTGNRIASMPAECYTRGGYCEFASTTGNTDCTQAVAAPAGTYSVTAQAFPTCGTCTADTCSCHGPTPVTSTPVPFTFPGTGVVDVVFGPCAFGCPDAG